MKSLKRIILTTGVMISLFGAPIVQNNPLMDYMNSMTTITAMAAEQQSLPYSTRWETQADGVTWKYRYDSGGYASDRWVRDEVDGNWYLMDENGIMRYGVFTSYGRYYLLSELHDGHFGHMVKNGEVYQGVTIVAEASGEYEGALSADTINALRSAGVNVDNVPDVTGTQHTSNGEDEPTTPPAPTPTENPSTGEGGSTTSSTDDINQTGKITDPNDLKPGQIAIINGHAWAKDSEGNLIDGGSTEGDTSGYMPGIS